MDRICSYHNAIPGIKGKGNISSKYWLHIGHRFRPQSDSDESSGQISAAIFDVFAFRVYLVFQKWVNTIPIAKD